MIWAPAGHGTGSQIIINFLIWWGHHFVVSPGPRLPPPQNVTYNNSAAAVIRGHTLSCKGARWFARIKAREASPLRNASAAEHPPPPPAVSTLIRGKNNCGKFALARAPGRTGGRASARCCPALAVRYIGAVAAGAEGETGRTAAAAKAAGRPTSLSNY